MRFVAFVGLATLGLGVFSTLNALGNAPAFNEALRDKNVFGDWRVVFSADMYDQGSYLFQLGHSYLYADALFSADTEGRGEFADMATATERAQKSVSLLKESLNYDPGNAHTWGALAWAYAMLDDIEAARAALATSWELAPYNRQLAERRVGVVASLTDENFGNHITLTEAERTATQEDLRLLEKFDQRTVEFYLEQSPALIPLAQQEKGAS